MKKLILSAAAVAGLAVTSYGQGIVFADNSGASFDTTINGVNNTSTDLNLELLLGTTASSVTTDVVTLLLSSSNTNPSQSPALGQVYSAAGDISSFGTIYDNSGNQYGLASDAGATVYLQVLAWEGNYSTYAAAVAANAANGMSSVFSTTIGATPTSFPADISGVGVVALSSVPEPTTMALAGLGGLSLLFLRRKK